MRGLLRKGAWFETRAKNALLTMTKFLQSNSLVMVRATEGSVSNHAHSYCNAPPSRPGLGRAALACGAAP